MCRMSWNLEASASWNPQGLSRPVMGLLLFINEGSSIGTVQFQVCEFSIRGRHKPCAWGMSRFSPHQQTWWGFDYSHHSPWFVQYHINFYDLISTEQDALSWNQLHFQPKDHERDYIPFLKINLFTPAGLCGSQTLIWRQAWHDTDQWQHTRDHMTITCMVFNRPPSYRTSQSIYGQPWNNDHASYIHQRRVLNPLTPNNLYLSRTAPLTSKGCILYIYSTNVDNEYFKHALHFRFFLFKMQFVS